VVLGQPPTPFPARKEIEMTKNSDTTIKTTTTPAFAAGDRVTVTNAATMDEALAGTIALISKGWYQIELDDEIENARGEAVSTISARVSSLAPLAPEDDEQAEQYPELDDDGEQADEGDEEEVEGETVGSKMAEALRKARVRYIKDRRPSGAATAHNGDVIARELRDYEPKEVCGLCDRCFDLPKGSTFAKYEHLNNGQQRMNAGNRIRSAYAKGDDEVKARIAHVLGLDEVEDDLTDPTDVLPDGTDVAEMEAEAAREQDAE
jgi:hypothetical protein